MRAVVGLALLAIVGCGPSAGTVYTLGRQAVLYVDEPRFRQAVELAHAGARERATPLELGRPATWELLHKGSKVRVLRPVPGGVKVVVDAAMGRDLGFREDEPGAFIPNPGLDGTVGWMLSEDLSE